MADLIPAAIFVHGRKRGGNIRIVSGDDQCIAERGQSQQHVFESCTVAHEPDTEHLARKRTKSSADLHLVLLSEVLAERNIIDAIGVSNRRQHRSGFGHRHQWRKPQRL